MVKFLFQFFIALVDSHTFNTFTLVIPSVIIQIIRGATTALAKKMCKLYILFSLFASAKMSTFEMTTTLYYEPQSNAPVEKDTFCFDSNGMCNASLYRNIENSQCACTCDEIGDESTADDEPTSKEKEITIACVNTACAYKETCDQNQNISSTVSCPCGFSGPTCDNVVAEVLEPLKKSLGPLPLDPIALQSVLKESINFVLNEVPLEDTVKHLTYSHLDFIKRCSIRGENCENITVHTDPPDIHSCYSINYDPNNIKISTKAGARQSIDLVLFVNQTEFIQTSEKSGVKLVIHEQDKPVFPHNQGISLPTGYLVTLALRKDSIGNLGSPYGKCAKDSKEVPYYWYSGPYTMEGCWNTCQQRASIDICGCGDPIFVLEPGLNVSDPIRYCNLSQRVCLAGKQQRIRSHRFVQECKCYKPCNAVTFESTYTLVTWPSMRHVPSLCREAIAKEMTTAEACIYWYRRNFVKIKIYYVELNHVMYEEQPLLTAASFVSKVGGLMGIFLGISFVSFVEFAVFIYDMIRSSLGLKLSMSWVRVLHGKKNKIVPNAEEAQI